jgi:L-alanine-DL-glutamate epimerase-like enolase superfamily enzyme
VTPTISKIAVHTHCNDLGGKIWNPAIRWTQKYAVFVTVQDTTGTVGVGECWCFDTAPDALVAYLRTEVVPHFLGAGLETVSQIMEGLVTKATLTARHGILASALAGIDIATWDVRAQHMGQPMWQALSGTGSGRARVYASGGLYGERKTTDDLVQEMTGHAARGFGLLKMKVGALSLGDDINRVLAVLAALPLDTNLIIDGVYSYSSDDALGMFDALPPERIEAFQSPTKAWDYDGMARLTQAGVPVMATEAEYRPELHDRLVDDVGVAFLQTAPIAAGGVSRVMAMADKVAKTDTRLSLEVSSTAIALMAAVQVASARPEIAHVEYHTIHTVFFDALRLEHNSGGVSTVTPPNAPGLGIMLPREGVVAAFEETSDPSPKDAV